MALVGGIVFAQEPAKVPQPKATSSGAAPQQDTLRTLIATRDAKRAELAKARASLAAATDRESRRLLAEQVRKLETEAQQIDDKFQSLAGGVDLANVRDSEVKVFDLSNELIDLLKPLILKVKQASKGPREVEQLRSGVALANEREELARKAVAQIERRLTARSKDDPLRPALQEALQAWKTRRKEFADRAQINQYELDAKEKARQPLIESTREAIDDFVRNRGLNLALGIGTFLAVFFVLRSLRRLVRRRKRRERSFYSRLGNVMYSAFVVVASLAAMMVVFDWLWQLITLIFLVGIGWASIRMAPQFFEQIRLVLNLGSVREGERLILNGLPWRVEALRLNALMRNEALTGGLLRIPLRDLVGMHSRPLGKDEIWFPCRQGDWVVLDDGTRAQVAMQSPDTVKLQLPGGGQKTYPTAAFLEQKPKNLSGVFRVEVKFGIDYAHQAIATSEVPMKMQKAVSQGLRELVGVDAIRRVDVALMDAASSSLDYEIQADFEGAVADKYEQIQFGMSRLAVDACNANGWVIPFTQVTVHQA